MATSTFAETAMMLKKLPQQIPPDTDHEFTITIPMRDGHLSNIRVHKPTTPSDTSALVVLAHGGGFTIGNNTDVSVYSRAVVALYNATVVSISYRLAPEYKFPTAPNDVWDSLEWLSPPENVSFLGANISAGFVIGGISAGANLIAVTAQKWLQAKRLPPLTGIWLSIPYMLEYEIVPAKYRELWLSREQNASSLIVNGTDMKWIEGIYEPDYHSVDFSPFNAAEPHKGQPPVYLQVCGQDPVRDDGLVYERVLRDNGVETRLDVYPGVPHGHNVVFPTLKSSYKCNLDSVKGIGWLLKREEVEEGDVAKAWEIS